MIYKSVRTSYFQIMSEKDSDKRDEPKCDVQKPSSSSSSAASETVKRGAAKFRAKLQKRKGGKGSLRDQISSAVKFNNNLKDEIQSVKGTTRNNNRSPEDRKTQNKSSRVKVSESNKFKGKGKNYPTPRSAREPKELTEDEIGEVMKRRMVYDTKVGGRSAGGGFKFRKPPRLGSDSGRRRRMDRIYSANDSDEEDEREGAYGYGNGNN